MSFKVECTRCGGQAEIAEPDQMMMHATTLPEGWIRVAAGPLRTVTATDTGELCPDDAEFFRSFLAGATIIVHTDGEAA